MIDVGKEGFGTPPRAGKPHQWTCWLTWPIRRAGCAPEVRRCDVFGRADEEVDAVAPIGIGCTSCRGSRLLRAAVATIGQS